MANPERSDERAVVLYQGSALETIGTRALTFSEGQLRNPRFFIPEDIAVSKYGVTGFLVVDNRPEQRWMSYTDGEWIGVRVREESLYGDADKSHFVDTEKGFKMVRYFVLPATVSDFFARDKFLGEPFIDKCCRDNTLPEEFDEEPARPTWVFGSEGWTEGAVELVEAVVKATRPDLSDEELKLYTLGRDQYSYVSFHSWHNFKHVIDEGQTSIFASLNNFDTLLSRFDTNKLLKVRDLQVTVRDDQQLDAGSEE